MSVIAEWNWDDKLITGEETVDYQHKILFRVINDLIRALNMSDNTTSLLTEVAIDELLKYAGYHFSEEEEIMKKKQYIGFGSHKAQHEQFVTSILNFKKRYNQDENVGHDLINFMQNWLINHILKLDKEALKA